jgi:hypothetical protein
LDAQRPVGVEGILHPRILDDDVVVRQIAGEIERVRPGGTPYGDGRRPLRSGLGGDEPLGG